MGIEKKCEYCDSSFKTWKCRLNIGSGKYCSRECANNAMLGKPNIKNSGKNSNFWKGGIAPLNKRIRNHYKYRLWRDDVFTRDDYTCQKCGIRGGRLEPHHVVPFATLLLKNSIKRLSEALACVELWNINNGLTLCHDCHKLTNNYGWKYVNDAKQAEFSDRKPYKL